MLILESLRVLAMGMLGIFVVMGLIYLCIFALSKAFDRKNEG